MQTIYLEPSAVPAILRAGYNGKRFKAIITDQPVTLSETYWDGGTRSTYALVNLANGETFPATGRALNPPQFGGVTEPIRLKIPPGFTLREHSIFCGKDTGFTFYLRPENAAQFLPAPAELSPCERAVLEYTRSRKSSYMGRNRYQMYLEDRHYKSSESDPFTLAEWQAAQTNLAARKYLNKAYAITPAGRNVIGDSRQFCS